MAEFSGFIFSLSKFNLSICLHRFINSRDFDTGVRVYRVLFSCKTLALMVHNDQWGMHWLPSYPLKDCRCGYKEARRKYFANCSLLQPLLQYLLNKFVIIPELPFNMRQIDHVLNSLSKSEVGIVLGKWKTV